MAIEIEKDQQAMVSHRMNFWGRPTSASTVSWEYRGQPWLVDRPDDGSTAVRHSVQCAVCKQALNFTVHSVEATRRRQARWRACAYAGLAVFLAGLISIFTLGNPGVAVPALVLGATFGWCCGLVAAAEAGVTGHGASLPIVPKHAVTIESVAKFVCERCDHEENIPGGSYYRQDYVAQQYKAAKSRFENHNCGRP